MKHITSIFFLLFVIGCNNGRGEMDLTKDDNQAIKSNPRAQFIEFDTPPAPLAPISPEYPAEAQADQIEGMVILQVYILADGTVEETIVLNSLRDDLDQAAVNAILAVTFEPATANGEAVGVWITIPINFKLTSNV